MHVCWAVGEYGGTVAGMTNEHIKDWYQALELVMARRACAGGLRCPSLHACPQVAYERMSTAKWHAATAATALAGSTTAAAAQAAAVTDTPLRGAGEAGGDAALDPAQLTSLSFPLPGFVALQPANLSSMFRYSMVQYRPPPSDAVPWRRRKRRGRRAAAGEGSSVSGGSDSDSGSISGSNRSLGSDSDGASSSGSGRGRHFGAAGSGSGSGEQGGMASIATPAGIARVPEAAAQGGCARGQPFCSASADARVPASAAEPLNVSTLPLRTPLLPMNALPDPPARLLDTRLLAVVVGAMLKLAARCPDLAPRASLCFAKVRVPCAVHVLCMCLACAVCCACHAPCVCLAPRAA